MGKKSKLAALAVGASLLLGTFGLTACVPENDDKTGNKVPEDIYAIYTAYAETAGEDAMTYDEWYAHLLETAKGDKGDDGKSAYDIWKENGHSGTEAEFLEWLKGGKGDDGKSAYDIWKEQDGNAEKTEAEFLEWLKGGKGDDGKSAYDIWKEQDGNAEKTEAEFLEWLKGDKGDDGKAGTKWFTGEDDEPSADLGAEGDFYLNTKTFDLWTKNKDSGWTKLGCIKGADAGSEASPQYKVVKDFGSKTISTEGVSLDLNDVDNGTYFLVVESDSESVANNLTSVIDSSHKYDMYCPLTKGYKSVVVKGDGTTLSLKATTQNITGNVKLVEYSAPTIKAGETFEIPITHSGYTLLKINIAPELIGHKVKLEVKFYCKLFQVQFRYWETGDEQNKNYGNSVTASGSTEYSVVKEIDIAENTEAIGISSNYAKTHCNGIVTVTLAD